MRAKLAPGDALRAACAAVALLAGGCAHWRLPWQHAQPVQAPVVHALDIAGADAGSYPQRWERNTLLVDLSAASGAGGITLAPLAGQSWPVRLALRVRPGAVGLLEVRGAERLTLPITGGGAPVELLLPPGLYPPGTPQLRVEWRSAGGPS